MFPALHGLLYGRRAMREKKKQNPLTPLARVHSTRAYRALRALENRCATTRLTVYGMDARVAASSLSAQRHEQNTHTLAIARVRAMLSRSRSWIAPRRFAHVCVCGVGDCIRVHECIDAGIAADVRVW